MSHRFTIVRRARTIIGTASAAGLLASTFLFSTSPTNAASECAAPYQDSAVYTGGDTVSFAGKNWNAKWWTQFDAPGTTGQWGVWADAGTCGSGGGNPGGGNPGGGGGNPTGNDDCNFPNWDTNGFYTAGSIVRYTNGNLYIAENENPGYDPLISTWYWDPYTCNGGGNPPPPPPPPPGNSQFPVSEAQFNEMFPNRIPFYSYAGLIDAASKYGAFTHDWKRDHSAPRGGGVPRQHRSRIGSAALRGGTEPSQLA